MTTSRANEQRRDCVEVKVKSAKPRYPGTAVISPCGLYRYELTRDLDGNNVRPLVICGLNPSTATADEDDATIRREIDFALRWGCGKLVKVNAYAYRATDPKVMFSFAKPYQPDGRAEPGDIVGPENDAFIMVARDRCLQYNGIFLVAWGTNIEVERQTQLVATIGDVAQCLGTNKDGTPKHPLYLPKSSVPRPWALTA